jgi:hypothetical protein
MPATHQLELAIGDQAFMAGTPRRCLGGVAVKAITNLAQAEAP